MKQRSDTLRFNSEGQVVLGDIRKPGHDYLCDMCAELFEVRYSQDKKPIAVTCPICGSGRTNKVLNMPATSIWWKDAMSSSDVGDLTPRMRRASKNRHIQRDE